MRLAIESASHAAEKAHVRKKLPSRDAKRDRT
jgi:hypothetical protein